MRNLVILTVLFLTIFIVKANVFAEPSIPIPKIDINVGTSSDSKEVSSSIQILLLLTVLSLAPSILIMMTSFTRIIIILSFLRNALGTQQMPPNQVLIGLSLFLTFFIMTPVGNSLNKEVLKPYESGVISQTEAFDKSSIILKNFMYKYTYEKDLKLFVSMSGNNKYNDKNEIPITTVIPAFLISELKTAFQLGFLVFIPFLIIDLVVSSTLMSMGMMMLPPVVISLPFKILLFIMVDGWNLISQSLVSSFIK